MMKIYMIKLKKLEGKRYEKKIFLPADGNEYIADRL